MSDDVGVEEDRFVWGNLPAAATASAVVVVVGGGGDDNDVNNDVNVR